jgi:hypothetical protein
MVLLRDEAQVDAHLILFGIVLILMQDRCTIYAERTIGLEIIWTHPMKLLVDVGYVETHFGLFGDNVSFGARLVHSLRQTYHRLRNHFGHTHW